MNAFSEDTEPSLYCNIKVQKLSSENVDKQDVGKKDRSSGKRDRLSYYRKYYQEKKMTTRKPRFRVIIQIDKSKSQSLFKTNKQIFKDNKLKNTTSTHCKSSNEFSTECFNKCDMGLHVTLGTMAFLCPKAGKVSFKKSSLKNPQLGKTARKLQAMQLRKNKRMQAIEKRRELGNGNAPHIIVADTILFSCPWDSAVDISADNLLNCLLAQGLPNTVFAMQDCNDIRAVSTLTLKPFPSPILQMGLVDNNIVGKQAIDDDSNQSAQLLASVLYWLQATFVSKVEKDAEYQVKSQKSKCPCSVPEYKKSGLKKSLAKSLQRWFSGFKFIDLNTSQDVRSFLRSVTNQKKKSIFYRESRPYLLVDQIEFTRDSPEALNGTLKVSGYPHGRPFDVNGLVHISGFGDFQMKQIEEKRDPFPLSVRHGNQNRSNKEIDESMNLGEEITRIIVADPLLQSSLQVEATPDSLNLEAPFSIEEDLSETTNEMVCSGSGISNKRQVITGTSRYQSAWISHNEDNEEYGTGDEDSDYEDLEMMYSESDIDPVEAGQDHFDDVSCISCSILWNVSLL
eukprot:gene7618-8458_t